MTEKQNADEALLKIEDLEVNYYTYRGVVKALDHIYLELYPGKITGLVGETGCGKSTTGLAVNRLVPDPGRIDGGKVLLDGVNLLDLSKDEMRKVRGRDIAMTFQDPKTYLNPVIKVKNQIIDQMLLYRDLTTEGINRKIKQLREKRDTVTEGSKKYKRITQKIQDWKERKKEYTQLNQEINELTERKWRVKGKKKKKLKRKIRDLEEKQNQIVDFPRSYLEEIAEEKVIQIANQVRLPHPEEVINQYPHELSTGMRQRVMISAMLSGSPKLFIGDEATTALDVTVQAQVLKMLQNMKDELNAGVLYITHNLGVIAQIADYVGVMYGGQVVEFGPVDEIFFDPKHPYTDGLLASVPRVEEEREKLPSIPGTVPDLIDPPKGCRFNHRCDKVMEKCTTRPPHFTVGEKHHVACWLYEDKEEKDE